jgi:hypothetical protein
MFEVIHPIYANPAHYRITMLTTVAYPKQNLHDSVNTIHTFLKPLALHYYLTIQLIRRAQAPRFLTNTSSLQGRPLLQAVQRL